MAIVGLRDHESRQEGAQGERCPRRRRSQGGERPDQDDRDQEQLPTPGLEDLGEGARDHRPGEHQHPDDDEHRLAEREEQRPGTAAGPSGEKREHQHHRHDAQVLEDQHAGREASVGSIDLALIGESLEDDGGAGERDEEAQEQRHPPAEMEGHGEPGTERDGEAHLGAPPP